MINTSQRIAVITTQNAIADHIRVALKDLFDVDIY